MSIIHDALKKIQKTSPVGPPGQTNPTPLNPSKKPTRPIFTFTTIIAGLGLVSFLLLFSFFVWPQNPVAQTIISLVDINVDPRANIDITWTPTKLSSATKATPEAKNLDLSGIVVFSGTQSAIINGRVFTEGDEIDGKKILEILPDQVKLSEDGEIFILRLAY